MKFVEISGYFDHIYQKNLKYLNNVHKQAFIKTIL